MRVISLTIKRKKQMENKLYIPRNALQIGKNSTTWVFMNKSETFINNKYRFYALQQASFQRNCIKKQDSAFEESDIKVELSIVEMKKLFNLSSTKNEKIMEEFSKMEGQFFVKKVFFEEKNIIIIIEKEYFIWKDINSNGKDIEIDLKDCASMKSFKSFFLFHSVKYYTKPSFYNIPFLEHFGIKVSLSKIKELNRVLRQICDRLGFKMTKIEKDHSLIFELKETIKVKIKDKFSDLMKLKNKAKKIIKTEITSLKLRDIFKKELVSDDIYDENSMEDFDLIVAERDKEDKKFSKNNFQDDDFVLDELFF